MRDIVCINRPSILLLKIIIQCDIKLIRSFSIKKTRLFVLMVWLVGD